MIFIKKEPEAAPCVIGIGSPHGADRLGLAMIELLRDEGPAGFDWCRCAQPARLPGLMAGRPIVVLLDALPGDDGGPRLLTTAELARAHPLSSHGFGVAEALALAGALGDLPPACHLVALPIRPDADPEARARRLLPEVAALLRRLSGP